MNCIKCRREIPEGSLYCNFCGKKQSVTKPRTHKRPHGAGTISKDTRYRKPWIAHAPSTKYSRKRLYIGSYATRQEAQQALDDYIKNGRPELYNATLGDIYRFWSDTHYRQVSESAISLYSAMWKRFSEIENMPMRDLRTAHIQEIVNRAKSKSSAEILKVLSVMLCRFAIENDILLKNYAEFVKIPKFEKREKRIFTAEEIEILWEHSDNNKTVQIILFMIYTGFRIGEITALKVSDVHIESGYIIGGEKTDAGKNRIIPIPPAIPELTKFISGWISETNTESLLNISTVQLRKNFYRAIADCGISGGEKLTPHSTRHTFASLSASAGMRAENLQKIIGHANYNTTAEVYIHQDFWKLKEEMSKLKKK